MNILGENVKVELDLSNYAAKADLKNATGVDTSEFDKESDLGNLKTDVDKLHNDKLKNVPSGLSSLKSKVDKLDIEKLEVVKKTEYNESVNKVNNINTTDAYNFVKKTNYNTKINEIESLDFSEESLSCI